MLAKGLKTAAKATPKNQISIHSYYLWSGILYCGCGVLIIATQSQIESFLCSIPPKGFNEETSRCDNCSDDLLFCQKDSCYQMAVNITYRLEASIGDYYYTAHSKAVSDEVCTRLIMDAVNPVELLIEANRELQNNAAWLSEDCIAFHCQVMKNAVLDNTDLNALNGVCTNVEDAKPREFPTACPCADLQMSPEEAVIISSPSICAVSDGTLLRWTFQKFLSLQDDCFQSAFNKALARVTEVQSTGTQEAAVCQNPITATTTTVNIFFDEEGVFVVPSDECRFAFCHAFNASLSDELCEWGYQPTLMPDSAEDFEQIATECVSAVADFAVDVPGDVALDRVCPTMIRYLEGDAPAYCTERGGSAIRRLAAAGSSPTSVTRPTSVSTTPRVQRQSLIRPRKKTRTRSLQTAPSPPASLNDAMPLYTVLPYSPCQCYLPCSPGVMVRDVTCLAGPGGCQLPIPENQKKCDCGHCADCSVIVMLFTVQICYFVQGGVALLVWVSFLYFEGQGEELAVSFSIPMKIIGFFCKNLPSTVRIVILANLFQLFWVVFISWVPSDFINIYSDCNESGVLRVVVMVSLCVCVFQLMYGRFMKKHTRRPPWLYSPPRTRLPTPLKQIRAFTRELGP